MEKIRFAVVGLGHIAQAAILPGFTHADNCELAALISGDVNEKKELAEKYGVPLYRYADFEEALKREDIRAVFIALPNTLHRQYTERAAGMGVHVLCEKPMAVNEEDCHAMIRACADAQVHLMVAYRLHFTDAHVRAIDLVKTGGLGELRFFNSLFAMQVAEDNIRARHETGGGPLFDIGIYCINAARYLFQDEPIQVQASIASSDDPRFSEVEEMAAVTLRFPGERLAAFTCSFGSAGMDVLDLVGTRGSLRIEPAYSYTTELKWLLKRDAEVTVKTFPPGDQFAAELIYFADCIRNGKTPEPSGAEGLADVRIIKAIHDSARSHRPVDLEPIRKDERPNASQEIKRPPAEEVQTVAAQAPSE